MQELYSDFKTNFDIHPVKRDLILSTDEVAVKNSIKNLIFTSPYERYGNPTLGAGIPADLFENLDDESEYSIRARIETCIQNYEPRAILKEVNVNVSPDQNGYSVTIVFETVNSGEPIILNQILRRLR